MISAGEVQFGGSGPFALIAGPCVIESEKHAHFLAREIGKIAGPDWWRVCEFSREFARLACPC